MKRLGKVFTVCTVAFLLTGCMKVNVNIDVSDDGSATSAMELLVEKSFMEGGDADSLKDSMTASLSEEEKKGVTFKKVTKTIDDVKYEGFNMTYDGKNNNFKDSIKVTDNRVELTLGKKQLGKYQAGTQDNGMDMSSMSGVEFNINITMPGKIIKNSAGDVKDGNTVVVNLLKLKDSSITIASERASNNNIIIYAGVAIASIVLIAAIVFFMRKKGDTATNDEDALVETTIEETPVVEETAVIEETPVVEEAAVVEEAPVVEETVVVEETPDKEKTE